MLWKHDCLERRKYRLKNCSNIYCTRFVDDLGRVPAFVCFSCPIEAIGFVSWQLICGRVDVLWGAKKRWRRRRRESSEPPIYIQLLIYYLSSPVPPRVNSRETFYSYSVKIGFLSSLSQRKRRLFLKCWTDQKWVFFLRFYRYPSLFATLVSVCVVLLTLSEFIKSICNFLGVIINSWCIGSW